MVLIVYVVLELQFVRFFSHFLFKNHMQVPVSGGQTALVTKTFAQMRLPHVSTCLAIALSVTAELCLEDGVPESQRRYVLDDAGASPKSTLWTSILWVTIGVYGFKREQNVKETGESNMEINSPTSHPASVVTAMFKNLCRQ